MPSHLFKDLLVQINTSMFKGEGQAPIPRAQIMLIIYEVDLYCARWLISTIVLLVKKL